MRNIISETIKFFSTTLSRSEEDALKAKLSSCEKTTLYQRWIIEKTFVFTYALQLELSEEEVEWWYSRSAETVPPGVWAEHEDTLFTAAHRCGLL